MKTNRLLAVMTLPTLLAIAMPNVVAAETGGSNSTFLNTTMHTTKTAAATAALPELQLGSKGSSVVTLQNDLNALGFPVGQATGVFDANTAAQVKAFQKAHKLEVDGVVGPMTWGAITTAMAALTTSPVSLPTGSPKVSAIEQKEIVLNGKVVTAPDGFTYQGTAYMPIWYVMTTLDQLGFSHTWENNVWNIVIPASSGLKIDYSNIQYGKGSTAIAINGTVVARVNAVVYADPASGQPTTFMPVWYVMNALARTGITSSWQGTTWTLKPPAQIVKTSSTSGSGNTTGNATSNGSGNATSNATGNSTGNTANSSGAGTIDAGGSSNNTTTGAVGNSVGSGGSNNTTGNSTGNTTGNSVGSMLGNSTGANGTQTTPFGNNTSTGNTTGNNTSTGNTTGTGSNGATGSFTNVDLRYAAPSNINQQSIDKYLLNNSSPLNGLGASFMAGQSTYSVDANYLVSHAILESYWGQSQIALAKNNLYGYGAYDSNPGSDAGLFPSDDYAIRFEAWEVRTNYLTPGGSEYVSPTLSGMNVHYATDPNWATSIGGLMSQFATSVGSSVSAYTQYKSTNSAPKPSSTTEPVYYLNGATATTTSDSYYKNNGIPYFPSMSSGMTNQFFGPLQNGSVGEPVAEVQTFLNQQIHAGLQVDSQFGPQTEAAVKQFQSQVMHMANPNGVWSFQMWTTYIQPSQSNADVNVIPPNTKIAVDQIEEGMAGGYVVPWYHVVNYGWVDSQYVKFSNVYRVDVQNPAGVQTSIPVYSATNPTQQIATLHSGDFVVVPSTKASSGMYQIQFASQLPAYTNGQAAGTLLTGLVSASTVKLVQQQ
ncbi:peptidoglycan-binding protein [Alicyclobacillus acidiphilus]|uniref:peptidoglycan-binding protein n=1 Tax=Alicyclobacillus acidiphilus TaxID=182455 RepID=UPI00082D753E|nr:peptidoglycan-binding protein [Alicyclobacillus acidiphilus]